MALFSNNTARAAVMAIALGGAISAAVFFGERNKETALASAAGLTSVASDVAVDAGFAEAGIGRDVQFYESAPASLQSNGGRWCEIRKKEVFDRYHNETFYVDQKVCLGGATY